jgi:ribosomal protein S27AE
MDTRIVTTQCPHCHQSRPWTKADRLVWLQQAGFLRKHKDPADEIVSEMFRLKLAELPCPNCQKSGVRVVAQVQAVEEDDDQWDTGAAATEASELTRYCLDCREQIDPDRLDLFPETTRCVECQRKFENGESASGKESFSADDLCPRCGDFLQTHRNRSSRTAYRVQCGSCGYAPKR